MIVRITHSFSIVLPLFLFCVLCTQCVLPVSLNCPFMTASSVFSNVFVRPMSYVPSIPISLDCQFLIALSVFSGVIYVFMVNKGNNKITKLRTILQRESQNS
jgi:hypothetical protein